MDGVPSLCEGLKEQVNRNDRRKREIMETWQYCAPCLMGVEGIVGDELKRMDAGEVRVENGRVLFSGGPELLARANIGLRCAERVQIFMGSFPACSFESFFRGLRHCRGRNGSGKTTAFRLKDGR